MDRSNNANGLLRFLKENQAYENYMKKTSKDRDYKSLEDFMGFVEIIVNEGRYISEIFRISFSRGFYQEYGDEPYWHGIDMKWRQVCWDYCDRP
jgi:hypothetical protein